MNYQKLGEKRQNPGTQDTIHENLTLCKQHCRTESSMTKQDIGNHHIHSKYALSSDKSKQSVFLKQLKFSCRMFANLKLSQR